MLRPRVTPSRLQHQHQPLAGNSLGVLCWNVQKLTREPHFQHGLAMLTERYATSLLLLQEARLAPMGDPWLEDWSWAVSPNMQTRTHLFGVLTAGQCAFDDVRPLLSQSRELRFATHKSLILTRHPLPGDGVLLVVNMHAINFVHAGLFLKEMELLRAELLRHAGPLIVAGDFNVWSRQRRLYLRRFCRAVGLRQAVMENAHHVKSYLHQPLDFIFYRDLYLRSAEAINMPGVSDHNPIYARFLL
ncbi:endonuclease/exonuclease/phosphatase family protein [Oceanimonas pelagia]|uniref:Endonuclease/exonuclease/phosphatase family protein n=1 Tax=Oceanimonas pelagia TaxID=3028314 RepID=A0AA50KM78_9GAMM|nr:endonuclease/exonuclease/phosphatase family protein [Oceanimonas pelagia]WMC10711.1 endonuclease/exonuclease/phosphatase family protein [Oceanimonas pelagia]